MGGQVFVYVAILEPFIDWPSTRTAFDLEENRTQAIRRYSLSGPWKGTLKLNLFTHLLRFYLR